MDLQLPRNTLYLSILHGIFVIYLFNSHGDDSLTNLESQCGVNNKLNVLSYLEAEGEVWYPLNRWNFILLTVPRQYF